MINFFLKKTRKFRKNNKIWFIQSIGPRFLHIFPIFRADCGFPAKRTVRFFRRSICRAIFEHLRNYRSAAQQMRVPSMRTNGNRKEPSLESTAGGVGCPIQVQQWYP